MQMMTMFSVACMQILLTDMVIYKEVSTRVSCNVAQLTTSSQHAIIGISRLVRRLFASSFSRIDLGSISTGEGRNILRFFRLVTR